MKFSSSVFLLLTAVSATVTAALPCQQSTTIKEAQENSLEENLSQKIVKVANEPELQAAVSNLEDGYTIVVAPGRYQLTKTLYIRKNNVTIRGNGDTCEDVVLLGNGMDNAEYGNAPHGIWSDARHLSISDLTIRDFYFHAVILNPGASSPRISSVQLLNSGEQFIKSNAKGYADGVNDGVVEFSRIAYTDGVPQTNHEGAGLGYTNGIDIHGGKRWRINHNQFENLSMPDTYAWLWNPAVLAWNGSAETLVENNIFINVDRAVAFGLIERNGQTDHRGGTIRNNIVYYEDNLYSANRRAQSDGAIIVWNSPNSIVAHNTVVTNKNTNKSIEFRFDTQKNMALNNLVDAPIGSRGNSSFIQQGNYYYTASTPLLAEPPIRHFQLSSLAKSRIIAVEFTEHSPLDIDGIERQKQKLISPGAQQISP